MIEHGHPLLEDDTGMTRFEPTPPRAFDEARIQNLIATRPELLPFEALHERDFGHARSIGTEITIANEEGTRGRIDVLLLNEIGRLTIVETKLFSNPQARREALAQIIEYAALLKKLDYEGLGKLVHSSRPDIDVPEGADPLVTIAREAGIPVEDEAAFHDRVQDNLEKGRFLLLVVGEGIHSNLASMCSLFDRTAHMAFTLGLVELRHYTSVPPGRELWVPHVAGSVLPVPRTYFQPGESLNSAASSDADVSVLESGAPGGKRRRSKLSEIEARDAFMTTFERSQAEPAPHTIMSLIGHAEAHGLFPEFTATGSSLIIRCFDEVTEYPYNLLTINSDGRLGATDFLQWQLESQRQNSGIAVKHYGRIADLFGGAKWTPAPTSKNPDRHQIRDHAGKPPFFSTGLDSGMEPTDFLDRLFEIFEETAQSIREDSARLSGK